MKQLYFSIALFLFVCASVDGQFLNKQFVEYILQYRLLAMDHQDRFKIPASIVLAQGVFESGAGRSRLTMESNNHFGIKCYNGWNGPRVYHDDDIKNDCFRKYDRAEDSYEDHSLFLSRKPRYAPLFNLEITDYRGWAIGLQQLGYATDPSYANKLIKVIEDYELYIYDVRSTGRREVIVEEVKPTPKLPIHEVFISQGLLYVVARAGDTFVSIASELDFKPQDLLKYNESPENFPLSTGDIVYLQKKNKAVKGSDFHVIKSGDSMHSIAQHYGIRMNYLYKLNKLDGEYIPADGDTLKLK